MSRNTKKVQKSAKMCKNNPKVCDLPPDLESLVYMFAYNLPKEQVHMSLNTMLEVNSWNLPFWFLNERIWSWHYHCYMESPLKSFFPIEYFGGQYKKLFNVDTIYSFLIGLDFRMKNVRSFGSRQLWEARMLQSWRIMDSLSCFYKMLLHSRKRVLRKNSFYEEFYVMGKPTKL